MRGYISSGFQSQKWAAGRNCRQPLMTRCRKDQRPHDGVTVSDYAQKTIENNRLKATSYTIIVMICDMWWFTLYLLGQLQLYNLTLETCRWDRHDCPSNLRGWYHVNLNLSAEAVVARKPMYRREEVSRVKQRTWAKASRSVLEQHVFFLQKWHVLQRMFW